MEDCPTHPSVVAHYCEPLYAACMESAEDADVGLKQSALFGLGVCAVVLKQAYASQAERVMTLLNTVVNDTKLNHEYDVATDNAISSMAKIFIHTYNSGQPVNGVSTCPPAVVQLMTNWVHLLPCDGDLMEAQKIHDMLTQFIMANNSIIMGENFSNLPIILGIFGKILARPDWEDICTPETKERIVGIFQQLQRAMPEAQVKSLLQAMNDEQRQAFQPYVLNQAIFQQL
jgi:hypothetical protein